MSADSYTTPHGFRFGPVLVERFTSIERKGREDTVAITLTTKREKLTIWITPTGFIRVGDIQKNKSYFR